MFNKANKNIFHVSSLWSGKKRDRKISPEVGNLVEISKNHKNPPQFHSKGRDI